jgi:hypothetical protein
MLLLLRPLVRCVRLPLTPKNFLLAEPGMQI